MGFSADENGVSANQDEANTEMRDDMWGRKDKKIVYGVLGASALVVAGALFLGDSPLTR